MRKEYPCIEINLSKISHNVKKILSMCKNREIEVVGVTKVFLCRITYCRSYLRCRDNSNW